MTGADEDVVARLKVSEVQGSVKDGSDGPQLSRNPALGLKPSHLSWEALARV